MAVYLSSGDMLVLYSEGITEAQNRVGEIFGKQRWQSLPVEARAYSRLPLRYWVDSLLSFIGEATQADDISLLII